VTTPADRSAHLRQQARAAVAGFAADHDRLVEINPRVHATFEARRSHVLGAVVGHLRAYRHDDPAVIGAVALGLIEGLDDDAERDGRNGGDR
jgi:hypothetical protein